MALLTDKTAVVTGGSRGIGSTTAQRFTVATDLKRLHEAAARHGGIDIVFANAGVGRGAPLLPLIRQHGAIILNSSVAADRGRPRTGVYAATKAAVRSLARTWANELASVIQNTTQPRHPTGPTGHDRRSRQRCAVLRERPQQLHHRRGYNQA
jgi:NAD(P)-dependent dehydrogenase (short-subunit alcohol dehydrogenase family)